MPWCVPLLVLNLVGGAIADKVERRRYIIGCQLLGLTGTLGLVANSMLDNPNLMAIYLCGAVDICAFALGAPAERASVIRVVGREHVASAMAAFGLVDGLVLSLLTLAFAGGADMISGISRQAILQLASPPELVGRMEGVGMAVWTGGPRLGDLQSGVVASATSVPVAIVSGGLGCALVMSSWPRPCPASPDTRRRATMPPAAGAWITV